MLNTGLFNSSVQTRIVYMFEVAWLESNNTDFLN